MGTARRTISSPAMVGLAWLWWEDNAKPELSCGPWCHHPCSHVPSHHRFRYHSTGFCRALCFPPAATSSRCSEPSPPCSDSRSFQSTHFSQLPAPL